MWENMGWVRTTHTGSNLTLVVVVVVLCPASSGSFVLRAFRTLALLAAVLLLQSCWRDSLDGQGVGSI
jgi:hypothetical protein